MSSSRVRARIRAHAQPPIAGPVWRRMSNQERGRSSPFRSPTWTQDFNLSGFHGVLAGLRTEATVGALTANSRSGAKECSHGNFLLSAQGTPLGATTLRKWKAGSCAPNRYQAVPSQRAIGMGNFVGNSKSPTTLRL